MKNSRHAKSSSLRDNDQLTDGNPGLTKATEAAKTIRARLAVPQFNDTTTKPTDFNDLHQLEGLDTVKTQIENATTPKESDEDIIIRLAALPPLEYERHREDAANKLVCRTGILDKLVDAKRPKKADAEFQGGALEPWDDVVDGAALLDELRATYRRFMVLPSQADVLTAVWTLNSKTVKGYFREQFEEAFCRYLLPDPASIREAVRVLINIERNEVLPSASDASPCGWEKAIPANDDAAPRGLADEKPVDAEKQLVEADLL